MKILITIKSFLNFLYNNLIDLIWTKKIKFEDGTEMTTVPTVPTSFNLFDLKIDLKPLFSKGWSYICKTVRQDLSKTSCPKLYAFIKKLFDNVNYTLSWGLRYGSVNSLSYNIIYVNGYYYYYKISVDGISFYKTDNLDNEPIKVGSDFSWNIGSANIFLVDNNYIIGASRWGIVVFKIDSEEVRYYENPLGSFKGLYLVDNYIVFDCAWNGWSYLLKQDIWSDDFIEKISELIIGNAPHFHIGNYYYHIGNNNAYKGTNINNIDTEMFSYWKVFFKLQYENTLIVGIYDGNDITYKIENGIITTYSNTGLSNYVDINHSSTGILYNTTIFCWNDRFGTRIIAKSDDMGVSWSNYSDSVFPTLTDYTKNMYSVNNVNAMWCPDTQNFYTSGKTKTLYSDKYIIGGSEYTINYYLNGSFKIVVPNTNNDNNLQTLFDSGIFVNYYRIDTTNENCAIPRFNKCYCAMFVDNDFVDTSINLPTEPFVPFDSQLDVVYKDDSLTTDSITLNNDFCCFYNFDVTALTLTFPTDLSLNYKSKLVFKSGSTATTINTSATIKYFGTDVNANVFAPVANKTYSVDYSFNGIDIIANVLGY